LEDYFVGDFSGTQLVQLDPIKLTSLPGRRLRLGGHTGTGVLSPDGKILAFGATGRILLVDLSGLRVAGVVKVPGGVELRLSVISWPRADRLVATAIEESPGQHDVRHEIVFVDPQSRRVVRRLELRGYISGARRTTTGNAVFLLAPRRGIGPVRILVASPDLRVRSRRLARTRAGVRGPIPLWRDHYTELRHPALALDGTGGRAFVVGAKEPIAEVDLRSLSVRYHDISGLSAPHLPLDPIRTWAGTRGPHLNLSRGALWLGGDVLAVAGWDTFPVRIRSSRWLGQRDVTRALQLVSTRSWRVVRTFPRSSWCRPHAGRLLCSVRTSKRRGPKFETSTLVAYGLDGRVHYRAPEDNLWWTVQAGRLFAGRADGAHIWELDPATGRKVRDFGRAPTWPLVIRSWTPPR
jgi:hypothetical protein